MNENAYLFRKRWIATCMLENPDTQIIRFGTSSFSSADWVGPFYPRGTAAREFLRHYATEFDTVEVDATYYSVPSAATVDRWLGETPEGFLFAAKFPRDIVHAGDSAKPNIGKILIPDSTYEVRDRFLNVMSRLGDRLGPLLIQFPYFTKKEFAHRSEFFGRLDRFLSDLPTAFRYAIEIRNRAWLKSDFADLCRTHKVALTLVDHAWMPHGDEVFSMFDSITADFVYIRLLGNRKEIEAITRSWDREVIDHSDRLQRWAKLLVDLASRQKKTLVYINNHYAGHAPATLRRLRTLFEQEQADRR